MRLVSMLLLVAVSGLASAAVGCREHTAPVIEPRIEIAAVDPRVPPADEGFVLLADAPTIGRFTTSVAIAKRARMPGGATQFVELTPAEQAYWATAVRGLAAVRAPLFLNQRMTMLSGTEIEGLCEAARTYGAGLLVVYAQNPTGPNATHVLGAIYDTADGTPIASLHASARYVDDENDEVSVQDYTGDHRGVDARFQCQRRFEGYALAAVEHLIRSDSPAPTTQPNAWELPRDDRWWLMRR